MDEYDRTWGEFDSALWKFKKTIFKVKRHEFCYAGLWSLYINFYTGAAKPCYCGEYMDNFYENIDKPYDYKPIGTCLMPHCFNGHMLLGYGLIPEMETLKYGDMRDRTREDGTHWINKEMYDFMNTKLCDSNKELAPLAKRHYRNRTGFKLLLSKSKQKIKKMLGRS